MLELRDMISQLGGQWVDFSRAIIKERYRRERLKEKRKRLRYYLPFLIQAITSNSYDRYDVEYMTLAELKKVGIIEHSHEDEVFPAYESWKPGINDGWLFQQLKINNILEFGAGIGALLKNLSKIGIQGVGVDTSLVATRRMKEKGLDTFQGDILSSINCKIFPDCVILSYFLDRCSNPRRAIENAKLLAERYIVITVWLPLTYKDSHGNVYCESANRIGKGIDALIDYEELVQYTVSKDWYFWGGGLTRHWGVSSEGFEDLDCYVLVFEKTKM